MGQHRYCRICVDGEKDHSTGGETCKRIFDEINNGTFDPLQYIDHTRFASRRIKNIDFYFIKSSNSRRYLRVEHIVSFKCHDGKNVKCERHIPTGWNGNEWGPLIIDRNDDDIIVFIKTNKKLI